MLTDFTGHGNGVCGVSFLNRGVFNVLLLRSRSYVPAQKLVERALCGGRGMDLWLRWVGRGRTMESVRL
jgi:hypothetical protein